MLVLSMKLSPSCILFSLSLSLSLFLSVERVSPISKTNRRIEPTRRDVYLRTRARLKGDCISTRLCNNVARLLNCCSQESTKLGVIVRLIFRYDNSLILNGSLISCHFAFARENIQTYNVKNFYARV